MIATLAAATVVALPPLHHAASPCDGATPVVMCNPQERGSMAHYLDQLKAMMEAMQLAARELRELRDQTMANIVRNV